MLWDIHNSALSDWSQCSRYMIPFAVRFLQRWKFVKTKLVISLYVISHCHFDSDGNEWWWSGLRCWHGGMSSVGLPRQIIVIVLRRILVEVELDWFKTLQGVSSPWQVYITHQGSRTNSSLLNSQSCGFLRQFKTTANLAVSYALVTRSESLTFLWL